MFRYTQVLPHRQVAVKVLLGDASGASARAAFVGEANLMAKLSAHPSIVAIYHADTAADGRPYLVMEYCSRPNLARRLRGERISVAEALRIGVRLAGAVETAHQAGILHRDIKPANVLTTDYGWPALTDFGISVLSHTSPTGEAIGMSIPWAAPEFFVEGAHRGAAADIYSLAATTYALLAGRSPFEGGAGHNSALELMGRIERDPVPGIGRPDVPPSLELVLARAMAKPPEDRFPSAAAFGRALQRIEQELHLSQTSLDVPDTSWAQGDGEVAEELRTRARLVTSVPAHQATIGPGHSAVPAPRPHASAGPAGTPQPERRRRWPALLASVAVLLAILAVVVVGALNRPDDVAPTATASTATAVVSAEPEPTGYPGAPADLAGERLSDTDVRFTWSAPPWDGQLSYVWRLVGDEGNESVVRDTTLDLSDPGTVCIEVAARAEQGWFSDYARACVS